MKIESTKVLDLKISIAQLSVIFDALRELPFRVSAPVISDLQKQITVAPNIVSKEFERQKSIIPTTGIEA